MKINFRIIRRFASFILIFCILFLNLRFTAVFSAQTDFSKDTAPSFVIRRGDKLALNGAEFRFVGANAWNITSGTVNDAPSGYELNDLMKTFNEMGITVVRFFPVTMNGPDTLEPRLNEWNEEEWKQLDYVIKTAREYNIRLIIPFVDNWSNSAATSGKSVFTKWREIGDESKFYTDETVIGDFKTFIEHMLTRINTYTGTAYKNDPTILAWETGNELSPPVNWTKDIAAYIKSIDQNHLVMDGNYGVSKNILDDPNIDIVSNHYYGNDDYSARLKTDKSISLGKKAFIAGEFGDSSGNENNNYEKLLKEAVSDGASGVMIWAVYGHSDKGGFREHSDGYQLHFPGDTPQMKETCNLVRNYAFNIRGMEVPERNVPENPYLFSANRLNANKVLLRWKGSMGADNYAIWRANSVDGPWEPITTDAKETGYIYNYRDESSETGYVDTGVQTDQEYFYKMTASNESGSSDYSNIMGPVASPQSQSENLVQNGSFEPGTEQNLMKNPGFEAGSTPWDLGRVFGITGEDKHSGDYSIKLSGENSWESITQTVDVVPQTRYKLTFYAKINGSAMFKVANEDWSTILVDNIWVSGTGSEWKQVEVSFNSGNNSTVYVYGADAGGTGYFDDFKVVRNDNLIQNPGFETGSTPWNLGRVFSITGEEKHSGDHSIKLSGENSWESITQELSVTPQTQYKFSFYAKINGNAIFKVANEDWSTILVDNIWVSGTGSEWKQVEVSFNSGNNSTVYVYGADAGGTGYFDDFNLAEDNSAWAMGRVYSITDEDKHSGSYSLKLTGEKSWESFTQTAAVKPQTDYMLTFYAKTDTQELLKLYDGDKFLISEYYTKPNNEWTEYRVIFNSGEHANITIYGTDAGGTGYFDDFELNPLDENSTLSQGEVKLSQNSIFIKKGQKMTVTADVFDGQGNRVPDATVQWSHVDPSIASSEISGSSVEITGVGTGNVVLKASYGTLQPAQAKIVVMQMTSLNLVPERKELSVGEKVGLTVIGTLPDDSAVIVDNVHVQFESSDTSVAEVIDGKLAAKNEGHAILTATAAIDGKTIKSGAVDIYVYKGSIPQTMVAAAGRIDIKPGETTGTGIKILDQDGNAINGLPIVWKSENTSVAAIDSNGVLTGVNPGFTTITAEYGQLAPVRVDVRVVLPIVRKTLSSDADLEELKDIPFISLPEQGQLKKNTGSPVEFDPSAKMWFTWDDDNFYIAAQVHDEIFSPAGQYYWLGDCIQMAVSSVDSEQNSQWYSFGIYQSISNPVVQCDSVISGNGTSTGVLTGAAINISRDDLNKNTAYKIAIPWNDLKPIKDQNGFLGLSALISSNNGNERESMLEWGKGIDGARDAYYFVSAELIQEAVPPVWTQGSSLTTAITDSTSVELSWPAAGDSTGISSYRIYQDEALIAEVSGGIRKYTVSNLEAGTNYKFKITAVNYFGISSVSSIEKEVLIPADTTSGGSGGGTNPPSNPSPAQGIGTTEVQKVNASYIKVTFPQLKADSQTRRVKASIDETLLKHLLESLDKNGKLGKVEIEFPDSKEVKEYLLELPNKAFSTAEANGQNPSFSYIKIDTGIGSIELPSDMFKPSDLDKASKVEISLKRADISGIDESILNETGKRPVLEINAFIDGKPVKWNNPGASVAVSVDYTPTAEEQKNIDHIVVCSIDDSGNLIPIPNSKYNNKTSQATFTTTHFSKYAISFFYKTFSDAAKYKWAEKPIEVLASKGIIDTKETIYKPEASMSRGEFVSMLVRAFGLTAEADDSFKDVKAGDTYYNEISIAKNLGLVNGVDKNIFAPDKAISRQDMMVLLYKAMNLSGNGIPKGDVSDLKKFSDAARISSYAEQSIACLANAGLVEGNGKNILDPKGYANRASAAALIYKAFIKY